MKHDNMIMNGRYGLCGRS